MLSRQSIALKKRRTQNGAAILMAMLTVTLVAAFAAGAVWQQYRAIEIEAFERGRSQAAWVLNGALDWARLILREDARSGGPDHLGEPWSIGLEESRLSSFLAADTNNTALVEGGDDAFLSGEIIDLQSRFNVTSLVENGRVIEPNLATFKKLLVYLDLNTSEADAVAENLRFALETGQESLSLKLAPLRPERLTDLERLGLSRAAIEKLAPFATVLPVSTPVNVNTASAEVLYASAPSIDVDLSRRIVQARSKGPFYTLDDTARAVGPLVEQLKQGRHSVSSKFFQVSGRLRLGDLTVQETSLIQRNDMNDIRVLWRDRTASSDDVVFKKAAVGASIQ